jgi:hypothetical protein
MTAKVYLGIDPGLKDLGWALVTEDFSVIETGVINSFDAVDDKVHLVEGSSNIPAYGIRKTILTISDKALGGMNLNFIKDFADATKAINASSGDMGRAAKAMENLTQELRENRPQGGSKGSNFDTEVMSKLSTTLDKLDKTLSKGTAATPSAKVGGNPGLGGSR